MESLGYEVVSVDMAGDFGTQMILGVDRVPGKRKYDIILANYVLMFLDFDEEQQVIQEMLRVAKVKSVVMIEMYPAKDAYAYHLPFIVNNFTEEGYEEVRHSKDRCILRRT